MKYELPVAGGGTVAFETSEGVIARWMHGEILAGRTYPHLPFVDDVRTIFDVGANCGSTAIHLARHHPEATVHAFEPGSVQRTYLQRNTAAYRNVVVHPFGLHLADQRVALYLGDGDTGFSSITRRAVNTDVSELVELRAAGPWARAQGIERIDILKLDVEGCEPAVLASLESYLPTMKVVYLEYDSRADRRDMAGRLADTHELYRGLAFLDQGECIYLRKDLADHPMASARLRELAVARSGR